MNIMINNYCNLQCSYCFAQETMHSAKAKSISMENFCKYLDWLKKNDTRSVRILGGEPTLCPDLEKFIDKVIEYDFFDNILLFSNMTFSKDITKMIIRKSKYIHIRFLPNINDYNLVIPRYKSNILYNMDVLSMALKGFDLLGINIYSPDQDLSVWEELICRYNINTLRFSIVLPNNAVDKNFDFYSYFHSFQDILLKLVEFAKKYKITLSNDCNSIPVCCFDDWAVIEMIKVSPELFSRTHCDKPAVDIMPDLTIKSCFVTGFTDKDTKLTDLKDYRDLEHFVQKLRQGQDDYIVREECRNCSRYKKNGVSCSCLSYRKIRR